MKLATGKKLAKPRNRVSASKVAGPRSTQRKGAAADVGVVPAAHVLPQVPAGPPAHAREAVAAVTVVAPAGPGPAADAIIRLGTHLTIREAVPLRAELLERVDAVDPVGLDASAVHKVDSAGLQVLLAFARQRRISGNQVSWTACSEPLRKAAVLLALDVPLGLPAAGAMA
jgi:anti-anti-sigma regulatory factor